MGYINELSCSCGYHKELNVGTSRQIPDLSYINDKIVQEKLTEFKEALAKGSLGKLFYIENVMSYCNKCNEIKEGRVLHYQVGHQEKSIRDLCHTCGNELEPVNDEPLCPDCGNTLNVTMTGLWD